MMGPRHAPAVHPARLLAAFLALFGCLAASDLRAQACSPPLADAGFDVRLCGGTSGTSDVALSGALSQPNVLNGAIISFCWTTDVGTFTSTGLPTACSDRPGVTLRVPNRAGRVVARVRLDITDQSGCTDSDDLVVTLETPPVILLATTSQPRACTNQPIELIARAADTFTSTGLVTYEWDVDLTVDSDLDGGTENDADATVVGVSGALTAVTVTPTRAGLLSARLNVRGEHSTCVATALVTFPRDQTPTVAVLRAESLSSCSGQVARFHAELSTTSPPATLSWDFDTATDADGDGDPTSDDQARGSDVEWVFPAGGPTSIRVNAVGTSGCVGTRDLVVSVRAPAVAAFTSEGPGCGLLAVTFRDTSAGAAPIIATWDFGDGSGPVQGSTRTHVYSSPGVYRVQLTITDGTGCSAVTARFISVGPNGLSVVGIQVLDGQAGSGTTGNGDGFADPGERVRLAVTVDNNSGATATGGQVRLLLAGAAFGARILDDVALLPIIPPGRSGVTLSPHLELELDDDAPCGSAIALQLVASGQLDTSCQSALSFSLRIGAPELSPIGPEIRVTTTPGVEESVDIASAGDVHALVFEDGQTAPRRILMRRYGSTGNFIDDARQVSTVGATARSPRVAWSETTREFAVIWLEIDASIGRSAVMLQRVDQAGNLVGARARVDIGGAAVSADVIWSGDSWIVTFVESVAWAQRLTPEGFLLGVPQRLDASGSAHAFVRAASGGGSWGAALVRVGAVPEAIVEIRATGSVGAPLASSNLGSTAAEPFAIAASSADFVVALSVAGRIDAARIGGLDSGDPGEVLARETVGFGLLPVIEAGLDAAFVAWQNGADVFARPVSTSGDVVGSQTLLSPLSGVASHAAIGVASDGLVFIAWADVRAANPEDPDIYARILLVDAAGDCAQIIVLGDIAPPPDGNGVVDVGDVVFALRASVGLEIVTLEMLARGDVAPGIRIGIIHDIIGDGVIDVGDVVVLLQASVDEIILAP